MRATFFTAAALFSAALAAPSAKRSEYDINVSFINDLTGATVTKGVPSGNYDNSISAIFSNSPLVIDGRIRASSAQLAGNPQVGGKAIKCQIKFNGKVLEINNWNTYVDVDGTPVADPQDVTDGKIACTVEGEAVVKRSEYDINVSFINDLTGATVTKGVPSGNYDNSISAIFSNTPLVIDGRIKASSAQLAGNEIGGKTIKCQIKFNGKVLEINNWNTFVDIDGTPVADPQDITDGKIACYVEGETVVA